MVGRVDDDEVTVKLIDNFDDALLHTYAYTDNRLVTLSYNAGKRGLKHSEEEEAGRVWVVFILKERHICLRAH